MLHWSFSGRSRSRQSRPAGHAISYARPSLEELEPRTVLSTMYPGVAAYSPIIGPTIEAYSPWDNVVRYYGDGFQTITGAYGPQPSATNNTGLFAIDNGNGSLTVSASNPVSALELGNSAVTTTNTQLPIITSSIALGTISSFANNGGALLEVPSGENGTFAMYNGGGAGSTSLLTAVTPYISLVDLPLNTEDALIVLRLQASPAAPVAPGLANDPSQGQLGPISPGLQGTVNILQRPVRATTGLLGGGASAGQDRGVLMQEVTPQEQDELQREMQREMLNHMRLLGWDDHPATDGTEQTADAFTQEIDPLDSLLLPPLLAELSLRDPLLLPA